MPKKSWFPVPLGNTRTLPRSVPGYAWLLKPEPRSVSGYAWLHKNVTEVGSRLRLVTKKSNRGWFPVTLGYTKSNRGRLRLVTQKRNRGRFPVMLGNTKT